MVQTFVQSSDDVVKFLKDQHKITAIKETRSEAERVVYLRGAKDVCYTDMMKLLGYIRQAGFKANIVIIPEQGS